VRLDGIARGSLYNNLGERLLTISIQTHLNIVQTNTEKSRDENISKFVFNTLMLGSPTEL